LPTNYLALIFLCNFFRGCSYFRIQLYINSWAKAVQTFSHVPTCRKLSRNAFW